VSAQLASAFVQAASRNKKLHKLTNSSWHDAGDIATAGEFDVSPVSQGDSAVDANGLLEDLGVSTVQLDENVQGIGSTADLNEQGYAAVAAKCCHQEMSAFAARAAEVLGYRVCELGGLHGLVHWYMGCGNTQTFAKLLDEIRDAETKTCPWVHTSACPKRSSQCTVFPDGGEHRRRRCSIPAGCASHSWRVDQFSNSALGQITVSGVGPGAQGSPRVGRAAGRSALVFGDARNAVAVKWQHKVSEMTIRFSDADSGESISFRTDGSSTQASPARLGPGDQWEPASSTLTDDSLDTDDDLENFSTLRLTDSGGFTEVVMQNHGNDGSGTNGVLDLDFCMAP